MNRRKLLLLILFAAPVTAARPKKLSKKQCAALSERMRRIESQLRQGHSAQRGRALKQRARELQLKRFRRCR